MSSKKQCRIGKIIKLSEDTSSFEIKSRDTPFETLEPGAHIDVYLAAGMIRQYSIWDHAEDGMHLSIAVKREDDGRGGSKAMHNFIQGESIEIDGPRNNFKLIEKAPHYTLIAGGIGVTPIFPMVNQLHKDGANFDVYYLVQKRELAAFEAHFEALDLGDSYHLHCDDESGYIDFKKLLGTSPADSLIYACGPEPMLKALMDANQNHDLHYERFTLSEENKNKESAGFEVKINSSGEVFTVEADQTILEVLENNGIDVPTGCTEGVCGTCITDVLEGEIDHRDEVLSDDEKASNEFMCVCVSRAKSKQLVLDL